MKWNVPEECRREKSTSVSNNKNTENDGMKRC